MTVESAAPCTKAPLLTMQELKYLIDNNDMKMKVLMNSLNHLICAAPALAGWQVVSLVAEL